MIVLVAIMVWLGRKRGMNYWNWIYTYLVVSLANLIFTVFIYHSGLAIVTSLACTAILIAFFCWPLFAGKEEKENMAKKVEEYKKQDEQEDERINAILNEWTVINVYTEKEDEIRLTNDLEILQKNNILTNSKYTSGFTTISVRTEQVEKSCKLLGVEVPCIQD